jgi:hypothetical protein
MFIMIEAKSDANKFQELLQTVQALQHIFRKKGGRAGCHIYTDTDDIEVLLIIFELPSKNDLKKQVFTDCINILIGAFGTLHSKVKIKTLELKQSGGIHLLKQFRTESSGRKAKVVH